MAFAIQPNLATGNNAPCTLNSNKFTFYTFGQWQTQVGEDPQSLVQNPGFNNPAYPADDYSLPNGSPGVGFVVFNPNQAGRSNPVITAARDSGDVCNGNLTTRRRIFSRIGGIGWIVRLGVLS